MICTIYIYIVYIYYIYIEKVWGLFYHLYIPCSFKQIYTVINEKSKKKRLDLFLLLFFKNGDVYCVCLFPVLYVVGGIVEVASTATALKGLGHREGNGSHRDGGLLCTHSSWDNHCLHRGDSPLAARVL